MTQSKPLDGTLASRLGRATHDIRNAATVLVGVHEELVSHAEDTPELADVAALLKQAMDRMKAVGLELGAIREEL